MLRTQQPRLPTGPMRPATAGLPQEPWMAPPPAKPPKPRVTVQAALLAPWAGLQTVAYPSPMTWPARSGSSADGCRHWS